MARHRLAFMTLLAVLVMPAQLAHASAYTRVLQAYQQSGTISPCRFSSQELASALRGVDTYGAQYFADFTNAIQTALATRASSRCEAGAPVAIGGVSSTSGPARPLAAPASVTAPTGADVPAPILLMAAIGAMSLLVSGVGAIARARGWDPAWAATWRHAGGESAFRAGGTWSEFTDWLRSR